MIFVSLFFSVVGLVTFGIYVEMRFGLLALSACSLILAVISFIIAVVTAARSIDNGKGN